MEKEILKAKDLPLYSEFHYDVLSVVFKDKELWHKQEAGPYMIGLNRLSFENMKREELYTFILTGVANSQGVYRLVYKHPG